jgi:peroxiredoxin
MRYILIVLAIIGIGAAAAALRFLWELLQQNGRMLLRMEALEKQLKEIESNERPTGLPTGRPAASASNDADQGDGTNRESDLDQSLLTSAPTTDAQSRTNRFGNRSLANSKIKRDGLKTGTPAPEFRLPRLDGGELALSELRGKLVLLVFSSPNCGPCSALAPELEKVHRQLPQLEMVMISKEDLEANREKVKEHGLTFPVVLQKKWEVSRDYAFFGTPVGYLIDGTGVIVADAAVGTDAVLELATRARHLLGEDGKVAKRGPLGWGVKAASKLLDWLGKPLGKLSGKLQMFELKHFKLVPRPDDIFIVTYPRSGTTWMQMILYQLTSDGNMEIPHIAEHCPWFERSSRSTEDFEKRKSPRIFKSHLAFGDIPKGPGRYIYVARDGRDVAVSYYNLYRNYNGYKGTFAEFFEEFMNGKVIYGSWFKHVSGWWKHRNELNVLWLSYEELTRDLEGCLRRIIAFCHLEVPPEKLPAIVERCGFAFMKQHESKFDPALETMWEQGTQLNSFLRAGRIGEGARELTTEQQVRFEQVVRLVLEPGCFPDRRPPITESGEELLHRDSQRPERSRVGHALLKFSVHE